jgi:hypothetical protein
VITVQVIGNDGQGVNYSNVQVTWDDGTWSSGHTNSSGYVSFNVETGNGTVYVDGKVVHQGRISEMLRVHGSH